MELKALIVDDNKLARNVLEKFLEISEYVSEVSSVSNAGDAYLELETSRPDVIFLDIDMPGENGLSFAETISKNGKVCEIVFATAYPDYALSAFRLQPADYLLKPFGLKDVNRVLFSICKELKAERRFLAANKIWGGKIPHKIKLKTLKGLVFVETTNVHYAKVNGAHTNLYLTNGKTEKVYSILNELESELKDAGFIRINRSVIVNQDYVESIDKLAKKCVLNCNGQNIVFPLSRNKVRQFERMRTVKLG